MSTYMRILFSLLLFDLEYIKKHRVVQSRRNLPIKRIPQGDYMIVYESTGKILKNI